MKKQLLQQGRGIGKRRNFTIKTSRKIKKVEQLLVIKLFTECFGCGGFFFLKIAN